VSEAEATLAGETALKGAESSLQFLIHVKTSSLDPGPCRGVTLYGYPEGGNPLKIVKDAGEPGFATVSRAVAPPIAVTTYHTTTDERAWDDSEFDVDVSQRQEQLLGSATRWLSTTK